MNDPWHEQEQWLKKVFQDCWYNEVSADDTYEELPYINDNVEEKVHDICRRCWMRDISADEALDEYTDLL